MSHFPGKVCNQNRLHYTLLRISHLCSYNQGKKRLSHLCALKQNKFSFHSCSVSISGRKGSSVYCSHTGMQVNRAVVTVFNNANHQAGQEKKKKQNSGGPDTGNQIQGMSPEVIQVIFIIKRIELVTCLLCDQVGKLDMGKEHKDYQGRLIYLEIHRYKKTIEKQSETLAQKE